MTNPKTENLHPDVMDLIVAVAEQSTDKHLVRRAERILMPPEVDISELVFHEYPSAPEYRVSRCGVVLGKFGKRVLKPTLRGAGYLTYAIRGRQVTISKILCETFMGPMPDAFSVAICLNGPGSCTTRDVTWGTRSEARIAASARRAKLPENKFDQLKESQ